MKSYARDEFFRRNNTIVNLLNIVSHQQRYLETLNLTNIQIKEILQPVNCYISELRAENEVTRQIVKATVHKLQKLRKDNIYVEYKIC